MATDQTTEGPYFMGSQLESVALKHFKNLKHVLEFREQSRKDYDVLVSDVRAPIQDGAFPRLIFTDPVRQKEVIIQLGDLALGQWLNTNPVPIPKKLFNNAKGIPTDGRLAKKDGHLSMPFDFRQQVLSWVAQNCSRKRRWIRKEAVPMTSRQILDGDNTLRDWTGVNNADDEIKFNEMANAILGHKYPTWFSECKLVEAFEKELGRYGNFEPRFPVLSANGTFSVAFISNDSNFQLKDPREVGDASSFGVQFSNNSWGNGALHFNSYLYRLICSNGMVIKTNYSSMSIAHRADFAKAIYEQLTPITTIEDGEKRFLTKVEEQLPEPPAFAELYRRTEKGFKVEDRLYELLVKVLIARGLSRLPHLNERIEKAVSFVLNDYSEEVTRQAERFGLGNAVQARLKILVREDEFFDEKAVTPYDVANAFTRLANYSDVSADRRIEFQAFADVVLKTPPITPHKVAPVAT